MDDEKISLYLIIDKLEIYIRSQASLIAELNEAYFTLFFLFIIYAIFNIGLIFAEPIIKFFEKWIK